MKLFGKNQDNQRVEIIMSNNTIIRVLAMVVLLILGLSALSLAANALLLIFTAFFLALALNAPVHWISEHWPGRMRGNRVVATSVSYLIVIGLLAGFIALLAQPAISQTSSLINSAPRIVESFQDQDSQLGTFIRNYNLEGVISGISNELQEFAATAGGTAITTLSAVGTSIASVLIVLVMAFMMLVEGPRWVSIARRLLPPEKQEHGARLSRDMYGVVRGYVNGQVTIASLAAVMILPVMLILDIPYAGALAVVVFISGLIPMVGHYIGATIVSLVALSNSVLTAIIILAFYILYQQIENYVVQPRVQANTTNMSPLLVVVAVLIGVNVNGILGGLVAIPIMGCVRIAVIDYLERTGRLSSEETQTPVAA